MANENVQNNSTDTNVTDTQSTETKPTVDELMAKIEQLTADNAQLTSDRDKYKTSNDKLSKESADYKRQLRAKQSAEEQQAEEQAEAQRLRDEEFEAMKAELNHNRAIAAYKTITDEKMVESLIEAVSDADHNAIANIMEKYATAKVKEAQAEWLSSRPQPNIGSYSTMTAEQIMQIPDREERLKAIASNPQAFK